jgi:D-arabinose 5-phosphate isomerase GutQ
MATPIISSSSSTTTSTKNKALIESLFEDSKNTLKNEYDSMVVKLKEDLNKSKQQVLTKIKKL